MYYLQCPKRGSLHRTGSLRPFLDYQVSGDWIMNMVQAGKMDFVNAKQELVKVVKNLPRHLQTLEWWHRERTMLAQDEARSQVEAELRKKQLPFRSVQQVDEWAKQYGQTLHRFKALVLDGPSGLGKTQFAKSLVQEHQTLELNMAGCVEPDLRSWDPQKHKLILYDECSPEQMVAQKKLFQAGPSPVTLGSSRTNCLSYSVWVYGARMVCCSNTWLSDLNTIVVNVTSPLYLHRSAQRVKKT